MFREIFMHLVMSLSFDNNMEKEKNYVNIQCSTIDERYFPDNIWVNIARQFLYSFSVAKLHTKELLNHAV